MEHKSCLLVILYEFSIPAQQTIGRGQNYRREAPRDTQREVDEKIQGESSYSHRRRPDHGLPGQRIDKVREAGLRRVAGDDAGEDRGPGLHHLRADGGGDGGGAEQDLGEAHRAGGVQGSRPPAELLSTARNSSPRIRNRLQVKQNYL